MAEQEARGGKILPAFFVEPVQLGEEFPSGEWPLHMTYFPPVEMTLRPVHAEQLRRYVNPMEPFMATIGEDDKFGPKRDIPVRHLEHTPQLMAVHRKILAVFQSLPYNAQYRMPYNPHISIDKDDHRAQKGDTIEIGGFSIAEKREGHATWQIVAKIGLKGAEMTTDARIIKSSERTE